MSVKKYKSDGFFQYFNVVLPLSINVSSVTNCHVTTIKVVDCHCLTGKVKCKVTLEPDQSGPQGTGTYFGLCSMKRLRVLLLPLDWMLVHRRLSSAFRPETLKIRRYRFIPSGGERYRE